MFVIHETVANKRKKKKCKNPPTKSPPFSYDSGFFLKKKHIMHLLITSVKKHIF
jgi:hypothetical protein